MKGRGQGSGRSALRHACAFRHACALWAGVVALQLAPPTGWSQAQRTPLPDSPGLSAAFPASLAEAQRALQANQFDRAEAILRVYLERNAQSADAAYLLAYALLREGKASDALVAYTRAATLRTPSAGDLRSVAQAYVLLGDYTDADKWLTRSLQMDGTSADTWYNLGRLRYTQNRFEAAVDCFRKALSLAPRSVKAENNLGLAYEGLNRLGDAEAAYRQALAWQDAASTAPGAEQPLLNLAILLLHRGDTAEAQGLLLRAEAIAPRDARIHEQLGQLYMHASRFSDAETQFKTATDLDPRRSSLHFLLGQAYKRTGHASEAAAEFAEAARLARIAPEDGSREP